MAGHDNHQSDRAESLGAVFVHGRVPGVVRYHHTYLNHGSLGSDTPAFPHVSCGRDAAQLC